MTNLERKAEIIPKQHLGVDYKVFSSELSRKRGSKSYLEIGVQNGSHLSSVHADHAVAVDPHFKISANVVANKKTVRLQQMTSDEFFSCVHRSKIRIRKPDLVFLDGLHTFEYLLRDFYNSESISRRNSLILMHDCLPLNAEMADRSEQRSLSRSQNTAFPGYWTGDVWKVVLILQKFRPDLKVICVDCPPTGLVCVTALDPESTLLRDCYLPIVDEFQRLPNDLDGIATLYQNNTVVRSIDILNDYDHTLYFRV